MPISPEAKYIKLHPRNVELLHGNVTAAYLMQFFIDRCSPNPDNAEPFEFRAVELSVSDIVELTGIPWTRLRTATNTLIDAGFLQKERPTENVRSKSVYLPILHKLTK